MSVCQGSTAFMIACPKFTKFVPPVTSLCPPSPGLASMEHEDQQESDPKEDVSVRVRQGLGFEGNEGQTRAVTRQTFLREHFGSSSRSIQRGLSPKDSRMKIMTNHNSRTRPRKRPRKSTSSRLHSVMSCMQPTAFRSTCPARPRTAIRSNANRI